MKFNTVVSNSFKYPFSDVKGLVKVFALFILTLVLPLSFFIENEYVMYAGGVCLIVFCLIVPGYFVSVIEKGTKNSLEIPQISIGKSIINTLKLIVLNIVYAIIPVIVLIVSIFYSPIFGYIESLNFLSITGNEISTIVQMLALILIVNLIIGLIFSFLKTIAMAKLASTNSLMKSLNMIQVIRDIRSIGVLKTIGWFVVMGIITGIIGSLGSFLLAIPYVGFIIHLCVLIPIVSLIYYSSLGFLFSDVNEDVGDDLDAFEKEIQLLKLR